jgi:hypothetical protein
MKRFIVSVLCVSVFFIGLGSLIENAGARFKSDEKALALIAEARQAIGGEVNIKNVRSMTITGNSTHTFEAEGVSRTEQGGLEINFEFPGKFNKSLRIGNPNGAEGDAQIRKEFDVFVTKNGETVDVKNLEDGKKVVIVKDGNGNVLTENVKGAEGQRKIIIKKDDGTMQEINPSEKNTVFFERKSGDNTVLKTEDGNRIVVNKDLKFEGGAPRQNEMFRTTFALLLSAPEAADASYLYAGEAAVDGVSCDVIEVQTAGSSFKLYLDKSSHLPRMLSYSGMQMMKVFKMEKEPSANEPKDGARTFVRKLDGKPELVEHQLKFSDFRNVGGLQLPHRWTQTVGGKQSETIDITGYEINPTNIAEKFREPKVFIRQAKPQQQ